MNPLRYVPPQSRVRRMLPIVLDVEPALFPLLRRLVVILVDARNADRRPFCRLDGRSFLAMMRSDDHELMYWCALLAHGLPLPEGVDGRVPEAIVNRARKELDD